ncbi:MAG TPA: hypothetical protein VL173_02580 [Vicinamibacterales bacterium]|nr:hypothetical protein [Vicinamibacterales bacterium]
MARHGKPLPARKARDRSRDEASVLLRSAESLGRVIGALQRQLNSATKRRASTADDVIKDWGTGDGNGVPKNGKSGRRAATSKRAAKSAGTPKKVSPRKTR